MIIAVRIGAAVAATAIASVCLAQSSSDDFKSFTKSLAAKEAVALEQKDSKFFENLYAPDFKTKDEHGVVNGKKVALYLLRYHFNMLKDVHYSAKILSLKSTENVGTVTLMTVLSGVTKVHNSSGGSPIKVTRVEKRVFIKKGKQWLMSLDEDIKKPMVLTPAMPSSTAMLPVNKK